MSRCMDVQRGAYIALHTASALRDQPDLFPDALPASFWQGIVVAACDQLEECQALRAAVEGRRIPSFHRGSAAAA